MAVGRRWRRAAALLAGAAPRGGGTPGTQEADTMLAEADNLQQQGQWGPALEKYKSALRVSPQPPAFQGYVLYNNLGWSEYNLGRPREAEHHYAVAMAATPKRLPTDHAYINLATLYKSERRYPDAIEAYRHAVALTRQRPVWVQLGRLLLDDFRVDEAIGALMAALGTSRSDSLVAMQDAHHALGVAHASQHAWNKASYHFVRATELGLPPSPPACRDGRWTLHEGWSNSSAVEVRAISSAHVDSVLAAAAGAPAGAPAAGAPPAKPSSGIKLVAVRAASLEGRRPSSLFVGPPECSYFVGEGTASGFPPSDYGEIDREGNASYDRPTAYEVRERAVRGDTLGVLDLRAGADDLSLADGAWGFSHLAAKLLILLKGVVEPGLGAKLDVDVARAKLFVPERLMPLVSALRRARAVRGADGKVHRLLGKESIVRYR